MSRFVQDLLSTQKEPKSILMLLEALWPEMIGRVGLNWMEYVARKGNSKVLTHYLTRTEGKDENAAELARGQCESLKGDNSEQTGQDMLDRIRAKEDDV